MCMMCGDLNGKAPQECYPECRDLWQQAEVFLNKVAVVATKKVIRDAIMPMLHTEAFLESEGIEVREDDPR